MNYMQKIKDALEKQEEVSYRKPLVYLAYKNYTYSCGHQVLKFVKQLRDVFDIRIMGIKEVDKTLDYSHSILITDMINLSQVEQFKLFKAKILTLNLDGPVLNYETQCKINNFTDLVIDFRIDFFKIYNTEININIHHINNYIPLPDISGNYDNHNGISKSDFILEEYKFVFDNKNKFIFYHQSDFNNNRRVDKILNGFIDANLKDSVLILKLTGEITEDNKISYEYIKERILSYGSKYFGRNDKPIIIFDERNIPFEDLFYIWQKIDCYIDYSGFGNNFSNIITALKYGKKVICHNNLLLTPNKDEIYDIDFNLLNNVLFLDDCFEIKALNNRNSIYCLKNNFWIEDNNKQYFIDILNIIYNSEKTKFALKDFIYNYNSKLTKHWEDLILDKL